MLFSWLYISTLLRLRPCITLVEMTSTLYEQVYIMLDNGKDSETLYRKLNFFLNNRGL